MLEQYPGWLSSTLASDAIAGRNVITPNWLKPLAQHSKIIGPAFVVQADLDDNQALVNALASNTPPNAGEVVVVAGMNSSKTATIGGLMALEIMNLGVTALITDGLVRDAAEIRELGLLVWCRGTTPIASFKRNPGTYGGTISINDVAISAGDLVIADDDGIVIWPQNEVTALLEKAAAKLEKDNLRLARLQELAMQLRASKP